MTRRKLHLLTLSVAALIALGTGEATCAQDAPKVDLFVGYTYLHSNVIISGQGINLNGGSGSFAYNFKNWLGVVGDFGAYHQGNVAQSGLALDLTTYLFGPRFSWRKNEKWTPFGQLLLGGGHAGGTLYTGGVSPFGAQNSFAMAAGGGLDWNVRPRISLRLFQAEYLRTQFANGSTNQQNNIRFSAGVIFHLGRP